MPGNSKGLCSQLIVACHCGCHRLSLQYCSVPQWPCLIGFSLWILEGSNGACCIDIAYAGTKLVIDQNAVFMHHRDVAVFSQGGNGRCACARSEEHTSELQ